MDDPVSCRPNVSTEIQGSLMALFLAIYNLNDFLDNFARKLVDKHLSSLKDTSSDDCTIIFNEFTPTNTH